MDPLTILLYAAVFLLAQLLRPKPQIEDARPAGLGDFNFPTATEGRKVPLIWGTVKVTGPNVVWYGDLKQIPIKTEVKVSIFSSVDQIIGFKYKVGIQFALCRGCDAGVDSLERIWIGDDVVFTGPLSSGAGSINEPKLFGGDDLGQGGVVGDFTFFPGTQTQVASAYLSPFQQEGGDTPAYRGTCYLVWEKGYIGNSTTLKPWAFELRRIPTQLGVTNSVVNGSDANPAHVAYEILTNVEWGFGQNPADIDAVQFAATAATLEAEGNGFSFLLDSVREAEDLLGELERQVKGKVLINPLTGLWQFRLARNDYVVGSLLSLDETNVKEIVEFSRGTWEETANSVTVHYFDRDKDYFETFAIAQDLANARIQSANIEAAKDYPGCKDKSLANNLAWRDLRELCFPLMRVTLKVDRAAYLLQPLSVFKWSCAERNIVDAVMRVAEVDLGELTDAEIRITAVQDIFSFQQPSFSDPFGTGWVPPTDALVAIPANEQQVFEAPRGFLIREPGGSAETLQDKVWCGARAQSNEVAFDIEERHAPGATSGPYAPAGTIYGAFLIGELSANLDPADDPSTISIDATPDSDVDLLAAFAEAATTAEMGGELAHLILIDDEFLLVGSASAAADVDLEDCWRGALDSAQRAHAAGARVYLLFVSGNLTTTAFPPGDNVDIRLVPKSSLNQLSPASATVISFALDDRFRRPYSAARLGINGTKWPSGTVSLDVAFPAATTEDDEGLNVEVVRRDFRTTDELSVLVDETALPGDFPAANTTQYQAEVYEDPSGANTLIVTVPWATAAAQFLISRTLILRGTGGSVPTSLRVRIRARHTFEGNVLEAQQPTEHDFASGSAELGALVELGALNDGDISGPYVAAVTGTFTFTIAVDLLTTGKLEGRINAGAFTPIITSGGGTSGTLAVTSGDTVEIRHDQGGPNTQQTLISVFNPSAVRIAFGVLIA